MSMLINSTSNVEFVYLILEGISQLALLNVVRQGLTPYQMKKFRKMQYSVKKNGDTTVQLDEYWIKADKLPEKETNEKAEISQVYIRFED